MAEHNAFERDKLTMTPEDLKHYYTADGWLSLYALGCGYVERFDDGRYWITLWHEGCYHVRAYDFENSTRLFWVSFDVIAEARDCFKATMKELES